MVYKPFQFFLMTLLGTWIFEFSAAYISHQKGYEKWQVLPMLTGLLVPAVVALAMIYGSQNSALIKSFWERLLLFKLTSKSILVIIAIPVVFFLATAISLLFGKSANQFALATEFNVMKGWQVLSLVVPLFLAPALEELGWRGYGVDSLRANFNFLTTSMIFALLWALWHVPLFFIKGYYQYELWQSSIVYSINFFISIIPVAIITNWIYFQNGRSILLIILVHGLLNGCAILFKMEQFTKCITTILLCLLSGTLLASEKGVVQDLNHRLKTELDLLRGQYGFPGATFAYILPDGSIGEVFSGWHDVEAKIAITPTSRMLMASIGKSFVAAMVLQLAKEERLNLDDPVSKWLGDRPWFFRLPNHSTMTIRHLLSHSSGLPDHVHMKSFLETYSHSWQKPGNVFSPESLIAFVLDQPPLFEAGKGWMYTDTGYILLGLIIEASTQNSYYSELEKRFLQPLHLNQTSPSDRPQISHLAAGYTKVDNSFGLPSKTLVSTDLMAWNPAMEWTGGGLVSTSRDLVRWAKLLYEGHAMKEDYLGDLLRCVPVKEEAGLFYGAGVVISKKDPLGLVYGHYGIIPGYTSSMRYFPECRIACAFQVNTDIGVWDHSTELVNEMQERLAKIVISYQ